MNTRGIHHSHTDFWQALSGALLAFFICVHLILEGTAAISPSLTNGIAWFLESTYIAQIAAPLIVLLLVFHFLIAARKMPFRTRELRVFMHHSAELRQSDTWLWLVQVVTAVVVLVLAFAHVYTVMSVLPISAVESAKRLNAGWLGVYAIFLPCIILHTGVGIYRIAVKYGFCLRESRPLWQRWVWVGMGCYLALGILSLTRVTFLI